MNDIKLAVFDCDGTLVDSQHAIFQSMSVAFEQNDLPVPSRDAVRRIVGLPLLDGIALLAPDGSPELIETLRDGYSGEWQKLRATQSLEEPLFPGTLEAIDAAQNAGWLLGVATGKSYRGLVATLSHYEILDRFVTLQTSDKVSRGKPFPDMMLAALEEAGCDKANAIMIGDTTFDIDMAQNAGVRAVGVNWGYHEANELMASGAECVINEFHELSSAINPNWER